MKQVVSSMLVGYLDGAERWGSFSGYGARLVKDTGRHDEVIEFLEEVV